MHLPSSHQMFSHRTTTVCFEFLDLYRRKILMQYYYIWKIITDWFDAPLHRSSPHWGFLDKKNHFFAFTDFESRHVYAETLNNMLRDLWTTGSLIPLSYGSKVPSDAIFASRVITKKCAVSVFNLLQFQNSFLEHITFAKKSFETSWCLSFEKTKKRRHQNFTFFLQN